MKWISSVYLILSVILAGFILYMMINMMVNYCIEDAIFYLEMLIEHLKYFLFYVVVNIVYLFYILFKNGKA